MLQVVHTLPLNLTNQENYFGYLDHQEQENPHPLNYWQETMDMFIMRLIVLA